MSELPEVEGRIEKAVCGIKWLDKEGKPVYNDLVHSVTACMTAFTEKANHWKRWDAKP